MTATSSVLTHDPKSDVPVLEVALRSPAVYVGAMAAAEPTGSGLTGSARPGSPMPGCPGCGRRSASTWAPAFPDETAVAIAAELIQLRWGGTGQPRTATSGRIHHG
jgi:xanthine dehydrogenase accessory factor